MQNRALIYSLLVHFIVFILIIVGVPNFWHPAPEEIAISLELLPVSNKSNVRPKKVETIAKKAEIDKHVPKAAKPKEEPVQQNDNAESKPKVEPEPVKDDPIKLKEPQKKEIKEKPKKEEAKKPEPPKDKPKTKAAKEKSNTNKDETDDFDALIKNLEESTTTKDVKKNSKKQPSKDLMDLEAELNDQSDSNNFNNAAPLTMSEKDAIRSQIEKNWNVPAGAKDAKDLKILLSFDISPDGIVSNVKLKNNSMGDSFFKAAAESAIRAVYKSSPLKNLPVEKYDSWKEIEINFDPSNVLY